MSVRSLVGKCVGGNWRHAVMTDLMMRGFVMARFGVCFHDWAVEEAY